MTRLRDATKAEIRQTLEGTYFTANSFSVAHNEADQHFLQITFIPNPSSKFSIRKASSGNRGFVTVEAPGEHIETGEAYGRDDIDDCINAIKPWASRIYDDLKARSPFLDEFEKFKKQMSEQFEEHLSDPSAHFSEEEIVALKQKLDTLSEKLTEVTEKNSETEKKLATALQEIEQVKSDLSMFPKGVWYRVAGSKVLNAIKKVSTSSEGRQLALEVARKYLLGGPPA